MSDPEYRPLDSTLGEKLGLVWKIVKLKCVRAVLKPLLRFHIWLELKRRGQ
jgi:hypothetical protein